MSTIVYWPIGKWKCMAGIFEFAEFPDVCRLRTQLKLTPVEPLENICRQACRYLFTTQTIPVRRTGISGSSSLLRWILVVGAVQHILFIYFLLVFFLTLHQKYNCQDHCMVKLKCLLLKYAKIYVKKPPKNWNVLDFVFEMNPRMPPNI